MSNKKPKFPDVVLPVGLVQKAYYLTHADDFQGKITYKMRLVLDDTTENREKLDAVIETAKAAAKENNIKLKKNFKVPFLFPEDHDEDDFEIQEGKKYPKFNEDCVGKIILDNIHSGFKPGLIDTARNPLPDDVKIFDGDMVRPKVQVVPYDGLGSGISLRLQVVQLVEKNSTFTGGGVNTAGFDDIDGYVADGGEDGDEEEF